MIFVQTEQMIDYYLEHGVKLKCMGPYNSIKNDPKG